MLIILFGLKGSGKSSWANFFSAKEKNTVVLQVEELYEQLGVDNETFVSCLTAFCQAILSHNKTLVIDSDESVKPDYMDLWHKIAFITDTKVRLIKFNTDLELCIKRDLISDNPWGSDKLISYYKRFVETTNVVGEEPETIPDEFKTVEFSNLLENWD